MTTQIERIILVSHDGRQREVTFQLGQLNVITGGQQTGKTSLIDIIDYCLGRESFTVAEGVIRQRVAWYGIVLASQGSRLLIARPAPATGRQSAAGAYIARGAHVALPEGGGLETNTNTAGALSAIADMIGLDNTSPVAGSGFLPDYVLTPRHVSLLMFQRQDEILSRETLFHRQGEDFVARTLREVLPYFLGAVTSDDMVLLRRLEAIRRDMRRLQSQIADAERSADTDGSIARRLLEEAEAIDLVPELPDDVESSARSLLEAALTFAGELNANTQGGRALPDDAADSRRRSLLTERTALRLELNGVRDRIGAVRGIEFERQDFAGELAEQRARLRSLELIPADESTCPVCHSHLTDDDADVRAITDALVDVSEQLSRLPLGARTASVLERLEVEARRLRERLDENTSALTTLEESAESLRRERDERQQQARVLGRISLYLETARVDPRLSTLTNELAELAAEASDIEARVNTEVISGRVDFALSRVAADMTDLARQIDHEYAGSPLRVDARRLTVVADTANGQVPMNQMGSGSNWVGCHLVAHLAMHGWFAGQRRPIINTLVLDQPSEAYFPGDREWTNDDPSAQGDRAATGRLLRLIYDAVARSNGEFQVILTEHADLEEEWYQTSIVERWRDGEALVPSDWPEFAN
jgi:regulator of replication initiation timing